MHQQDTSRRRQQLRWTPPIGSTQPVWEESSRLAVACATKSRGEEEPRHRHPDEPRGHAGGQLWRRRDRERGEKRTAARVLGEGHPVSPVWGNDAGVRDSNPI